MIHCKVTPKFTDSGIYLLLEWVELVNEQIVRTVATEEFALAVNREGCSYITRCGFESGNVRPGTFWMDESGHRHFVMNAEPGVIGLIGQEVVNG